MESVAAFPESLVQRLHWTGISSRYKLPAISSLQAEQLSPEWQYLFDEAGVTKEMLTNKASLQFILDTIYEIGGAPQNLSTITSKKDICVSSSLLFATGQGILGNYKSVASYIATSLVPASGRAWV